MATSADYDARELINEAVDLLNEVDGDEELSAPQQAAGHAAAQSRLLTVIATELVTIREFISDRA